jgi:hypothetical protein
MGCTQKIAAKHPLLTGIEVCIFSAQFLFITLELNRRSLVDFIKSNGIAQELRHRVAIVTQTFLFTLCLLIRRVLSWQPLGP